ncbi:hypothetical protein [Cytobacillus purgationiresistens]|uniref:Magnesium-transporting ATPase (P-type) n=1 Tax=Cytobacillus purgationiresistens TaxID=863449 RepID=A0ABU0AF08_9BACI|nr:hypothetical protein [Cytobacillus purgationiresistens]MDQ0269610.1 magnesium-transporting ATPase (P-type) [Cytobacillus purgationiresistens]
MDVFLLGPFLIKTEWILIIFAAVIAVFILLLHTKDDQSFRAEAFNTITNMVLIFFGTYKLSAVLFYSNLIFDNPKALLFLTGGLKGVLLGAAIAFLYFTWKMLRSKWPYRSWAYIFIYGSVSFLIGYWFIRTLYFLVF